MNIDTTLVHAINQIPKRKRFSKLGRSGLG